jgi:alkaline phosphatase
MAREASKVWKKYGALDYKECVIDDAAPPGVVTTFGKLAKPKKGEEVWFSFVVYKSRTHRDVVNKKVMAYFEKKYAEQSMSDMPFDMKRMAYGGFTVAVSSS